MSFAAVYGRNRRNNSGIFNTSHYSIANYYTDQHKADMKACFGDEIYLNNLHLIPDPLKKNLADTLITDKQEKSSNLVEQPSNTYSEDFIIDNINHNKMAFEIQTQTKDAQTASRPDYSPLSGITNFFSGMFSMLSGVMFRPKSPVTYYDCDDGHQGSPSDWQNAKTEQDKNGRTDQSYSDTSDSTTEMNFNRSVSQCESKINEVRFLLSKNPTPPNTSWRKRPKKVFVEPRSVEERFEDAFAPEDFVTFPDDMYIEYCSPFKIQDCEMFESDAPRIKTEIGPIERPDFVKNIKVAETKPEVTDKCTERVQNSENTEVKNEVVSSCEDKLTKLKALLQNRKKTPIPSQASSDSAPEPVKVHEQPKKPTKTIPIEKPADKRFKNPHRNSVDKRRKTRMRCAIQEDLLFANELNTEDLSSVENSPSVNTLEMFIGTPTDQTPSDHTPDFFNEVSGRFHTTSTTESEDSFQIVFTDSPQFQRLRTNSDCDSEDSFIVFEDSPDSCYTSNDVFGDTSDSEESDSDMSDSGCNLTRLSHTLTRTVSDLTDDHLYVDESGDEVDSAARVICEPVDLNEPTVCDEIAVKNTGLLLDDRKKLLRKSLPPKKVQFSTAPPKVHVMCVWAYAARQARAGDWQRYTADRDRFKRRIADVDMAVSWVLKPQHRSRVMFQRFMPWWNAQKRKELEEKKQREAEEKVRLEEEQRRAQEKQRQGEQENEQVVSNADKDQSSEKNERATENLPKNNGKSLDTEESLKVNGDSNKTAITNVTPNQIDSENVSKKKTVNSNKKEISNNDNENQTVHVKDHRIKHISEENEINIEENIEDRKRKEMMLEAERLKLKHEEIDRENPNIERIASYT